MGSLALIITVGLATFFNLSIVLWKFKHERYLDASLDLGVLALIGVVFGGSITALSIGMIASMLFSIYLLISPPSFENSELIQ